MSIVLPPELAEIAVDFNVDLGPAKVRANALVPWQNQGQNYASAQSSHDTAIFQIDTPRGPGFTGMMRHFVKVPCAGTDKGSDLLSEPTYLVCLGGHLELNQVVKVTYQEAVALGLFDAVSRSR